MPKTIKAKLSIILRKIKIDMLKHRIKKMERCSYLNLWDRIELRKFTILLQSLEQQQLAEVNSPTLLSLQ